jgi:hypothetical protein
LVKQTASDLFSENKKLTTKKKQAGFLFLKRKGGKVTKERGGHQHPEKRKNNEGGSIAISDTQRDILWTIWSLFFAICHPYALLLRWVDQIVDGKKKREILLPPML